MAQCKESGQPSARPLEDPEGWGECPWCGQCFRLAGLYRVLPDHDADRQSFGSLAAIRARAAAPQVPPPRQERLF